MLFSISSHEAQAGSDAGTAITATKFRPSAFLRKNVRPVRRFRSLQLSPAVAKPKDIRT